MGSRFSLFAAGLLIAQPAFAGEPPSKAEQNRQLSEVVFKNYPPRALAAGEQGPVFFVVTLDKDAHATSCEVTHGSGHPLLDEETCELIVLHAVFNSARDANGRVVKQTTEGVVNWTLPGHAPVPFNPILLTGKNKPEKQVCKENTRIGTLAEVERTCMTPSEWARQRDDQLKTWDDVQGRKGTSVGCLYGTTCETSVYQAQQRNSSPTPP